MVSPFVDVLDPVLEPAQPADRTSELLADPGIHDLVVGVRVVPAHRVACPGDNLNLDVPIPEVGQPLARPGRHQHCLLPAAGDYQSRPVMAAAV
jgi:hypothetical protein